MQGRAPALSVSVLWRDRADCCGWQTLALINTIADLEHRYTAAHPNPLDNADGGREMLSLLKQLVMHLDDARNDSSRLVLSRCTCDCRWSNCAGGGEGSVKGASIYPRTGEGEYTETPTNSEAAARSAPQHICSAGATDSSVRGRRVWQVTFELHVGAV